MSISKRRHVAPVGVKIPPSLIPTPSFSPSVPGSTGGSARSRLVSPANYVSPRDLRALPALSVPEGAGERNDNVLVTVRFRPLSLREIQRGDEVGWYADGDNVVRMESNANVAFAYDKVFGPATPTRSVYDQAAQPVVSAAMEGINGTVFAYGVTSSGKTHTMHGDKKSPGIIPLAVKEVFSIIQETPGREFLLRVSYLEIYNEVINDLLNPAGQNLRIREDHQLGTYVDNIKEEVVLSAAHALSLIATGEAHRHVGATNYNATSSRSHTIFTLTIESTGTHHASGKEEVALSQLHLIDLAGSESSKAGTTGVRRKEGSFINKSLLTLGTVIGKLSEGKHSHVPFRDSKLTRLLQSSLSGNGCISLICTVTPASGCTEETHNTLKFAQRAKYVEVRAEQNKILDEKSLIKKYQREITQLKQELQRLKKGLSPLPAESPGSHDDLVRKREKQEADLQLMQSMQSRLEEEEQAKAALMGRIQRLTKLILVSTNTSADAPTHDRAVHRRRLSFGEEDLAYLKLRRLETSDEDDDAGSSLNSDESHCGAEAGDDKKAKKLSFVGWLKAKAQMSPQKGNSTPKPSAVSDSSAAQASPPHGPGPGPGPGELPGFASPDSVNTGASGQLPSTVRRKLLGESASSGRSMSMSSVTVALQQASQAGELFSVKNKRHSLGPMELVSERVADQIELLKEQVGILQSELHLRSSALKRLQDQPQPHSPEHEQEILKVKEDMKEKRRQLKSMENKIEAMSVLQPPGDREGMTKMVAKLKSTLSEKTFDMEIIKADNNILQDSLQAKTKLNEKMMEEINLLRIELTRAVRGGPPAPHALANGNGNGNGIMANGTVGAEEEERAGAAAPPAAAAAAAVDHQDHHHHDQHDHHGSESDCASGGQHEKGGATVVPNGTGTDTGTGTGTGNINGLGNGVDLLDSSDYALAQVAEIEDLKTKMKALLDERHSMAQQHHRLAHELAQARAAAVVSNPAQSSDSEYLPVGYVVASEHALLLERQVAALETMQAELKDARARNERLEAAARERRADNTATGASAGPNTATVAGTGTGTGMGTGESMSGSGAEEEERERKEREREREKEKERAEEDAGRRRRLAEAEQALHAKDTEVRVLLRQVEDGRAREAVLENDLATMWVLMAEVRLQAGADGEVVPSASSGAAAGAGADKGAGGGAVMATLREQLAWEQERRAQLQAEIRTLKGYDLEKASSAQLASLTSMHEEALARMTLAQAEVRSEYKGAGNAEPHESLPGGGQGEGKEDEYEPSGTLCKNCFDADISVKLLPCNHTCMCDACAEAATICPICYSSVSGRASSST